VEGCHKHDNEQRGPQNGGYIMNCWKTLDFSRRAPLPLSYINLIVIVVLIIRHEAIVIDKILIGLMGDI
jgi:hypothetical protein